MKFVVVHGPPCSGKTTYVQKHIKKGDIVFDFDALRRAFTYAKEHDKNESDSLLKLIGKIRFLFLRFIKEENDFKNVYMIITNLDESFKEFLKELEPEYIFMETSLKQCLENLKNDKERADKALEEELIREYFEKNGVEQRAMKLEIRNGKVIIEGYVNAVGRDSKVMTDMTGSKFIEQIVPGTFAKALRSMSSPIKLLLNHDEKRELGSTTSNLELTEDNIGLWAKAEIDDAEIIEKAKNKQLRGWSFGFYPISTHIEDTASGIKRRFLDDIDLQEVSIIDETKIPAYSGTSIETRADAEKELCTRSFFNGVKLTEEKEKIDYSSYENIIKKLGGKIDEEII